METAAQEPNEERGVRVSILIVSQNQIQLLKPTLEAVSRRVEPEWSEVLVVDCGSQDGSARLDEEFEGVTFLRLPRNFGWTRAINIATRTAKGEYLLILPNGCLLEPDTVDRLLAGIEGDSRAGAVCPAGTFFALPKPGDTELTAVPASSAEYPFEQPVLLPRVALVSMNYLPDSYGQYYGDLELFHKIKTAGKHVRVLEDLTLGRQTADLAVIEPEMALADRLNGLSSFYSKNFGFMAGFSFWLGQALKAGVSFRLGLAAKLLGGAKVDGL